MVTVIAGVRLVDVSEPKVTVRESIHISGATKRYNHRHLNEVMMAAKKQKRRVLLAWTTEDVKKLRGFAKDRLSGPQTAKKLHRTPGAVAQKAMKLGIRFRSINRNRRKATSL